MLILISLMPTMFAINPSMNDSAFRNEVLTHVDHIQQRFGQIDTNSVSKSDAGIIAEANDAILQIETILRKDTISIDEKIQLRKHVLKVQKDYKQLSSKTLTFIPSAVAADTLPNLSLNIDEEVNSLSRVTDYAPWWVIAMISISLGLGTMIGWKRIVVTIGEKIGKEKLTYAQGTVASLMTAVTISSASHLGLPVSTTHILSSGVAGTMGHEHGKNGLQGDTIKSILMAWVLTLPVSTVLAGTIFFILQWIFVR